MAGAVRAYQKLTKFGIVLFVLLSALAGYAMSFPPDHFIDWPFIGIFLAGLYLVSAGSFALNQAQEWHIDQRMARTAQRPIPLGLLRPWQGYVIGAMFCVIGSGLIYLTSPLAAGLSVLTVVLYNTLYTLYWKRRWAFGAVPGAIPGAMPVVIGYAVNSSDIFSPACVYMFLLMFLWQMPHFWSLAIRYKEDYYNGGIPVLPVSLGVPATLYHMGLYFFAYIGVVMVAPLFVQASIMYLFLMVPLSLKLVYEFVIFYRHQGQARWLPFFLWTTLSVLVFLAAPVMDRWLYLSL